MELPSVRRAALLEVLRYWAHRDSRDGSASDEAINLQKTLLYENPINWT
jgi:hypothetical protein